MKALDSRLGKLGHQLGISGAEPLAVWIFCVSYKKVDTNICVETLGEGASR
jgi:hypothetical protein